MSKNIKSITNPKLSLSILTPAEIQRIHEATLQTIEKVGVRFPSKRALEIWAAHGAEVDHEKMIVKAKPALIEKALKSAPAGYQLGARDPQQNCDMDGNHVFLGTDGCGVEIIDIHTGQKRTSQLSDVGDIARVADATEEIGFHWVALSAQDKPAETRGLHEIKTVWENSTKHVQTESIYNDREARAAMEMAIAVAGSREELRRRPVLSLMQCTAPPLGHDGGSLDAALVAAEYGVPTGFMTMAANLTTGPATMAGNLVVGNAEVISATALIQLAFPGAPVFYAAAQTASDLRSGAYTGGGPEDFLYGAATNVLADFYNIPLSMGPTTDGILSYTNTARDLFLQGAWRALEESGAIRTLANPTLIARSGEKASFLAGGERPVPVASAAGAGGLRRRSGGARADGRPRLHRPASGERDRGGARDDARTGLQ
ncbi:MAG: trimethylamine methyltransferase family protein, partial [Chloroflexota bacterium]